MSDGIMTMDPKADSAMDIRLENFEGPLDLLLHLIKKNDLNISDIPIADITREYLSYLDLMKDLNLEVAGSFLVMASMLMQIKAQMLLPSPETTEEEGPDPRAELINKLLEYQQFKEASAVLNSFHERAKDTFYRQIPPIFGEDDRTLRASVFDLVAAFKRILEQAPKEVGEVLRDEIPLEVKIREIIDVISERTTVAFEEFFARPYRRLDVIVTFMAILELVRLKQIMACQDSNFGRLFIVRVRAEESFESGTPMDESSTTNAPQEVVTEVSESVPVSDSPVESSVSPVEEKKIEETF